MKKEVYKFRSEVWRWPGIGGWHFVNLPKKLSKEIKIKGKQYGAGFVKVDARLGKSTWKTALFPHKESEGYLLSIKNSIRKKENVWERDKVIIVFSLV